MKVELWKEWIDSSSRKEWKCICALHDWLVRVFHVTGVNIASLNCCFEHKKINAPTQPCLEPMPMRLSRSITLSHPGHSLLSINPVTHFVEIINSASMPPHQLKAKTRPRHFKSSRPLKLPLKLHRLPLQCIPAQRVPMTHGTAVRPALVPADLARKDMFETKVAIGRPHPHHPGLTGRLRGRARVEERG